MRRKTTRPVVFEKVACVAGARLEVVGTRKNGRAKRRHAREEGVIVGGLPCRRSLTPPVFPSRVPVLSFAHYFQAPATQATEKDEHFLDVTIV